MVRRVIIVDDSDPRYWDPRYAGPEDPRLDGGYEEDDSYDGGSDGGEWNGGWGRFPTARPRRPADGIRAVSQRGIIGATWWSQRFIATLESFGMGSRLTRGRSYARSGQVLSLTLDPGRVHAQVQGSRPRPYQVVIALPVFSPNQWRRLTSALAAEAGYAAALLAGQMPAGIEDVVRQCGLVLFPTKSQLSMDCSCPDWSVPCKHVAAVFYILAESFDADPFAILAWRGKQREPLLAAIRAAAGRPGHGGSRVVSGRSEALPDALDAFWTGGPLPSLPAIDNNTAAASAPQRLGSTGITLGGSDLTDLLLPAYQAMARSLPTTRPQT